MIGAGITGVNAGELIAETVLAIEMGADAHDLSLTIHPHPTLSETVCFAAEVKEEDGFPAATGMMTQLATDNQTMIGLYQQLFDVAEAAKEHGISNYASDRLDAHKKLAWMLRSILKA